LTQAVSPGKSQSALNQYEAELKKKVLESNNEVRKMKIGSLNFDNSGRNAQK
jgi:hypothetical protein